MMTDGQSAPAGATTPAPPTCPSCRSPQVGRKRMLYEAGTADSSGSTLVAGGIGNRSGGAVALSSGTTQSMLAKRCAPPPRAPVGVPIVIGIFLLWVGLYVAGHDIVFNATVMTVFAVLAGLFFIGAIGGAVENRTKLPAKLAAYEREWFCPVCGHEWVQNVPSAAAPTSGVRSVRSDDVAFAEWSRHQSAAAALPDLPALTSAAQAASPATAPARTTPRAASPTSTRDALAPDAPATAPSQRESAHREPRTSRNASGCLIVALLFAFAPAGLVLLWLKRGWPIWLKIALSVPFGIVSVFIALIVIGAIAGPQPARSSSAAAAPTSPAASPGR